MPDEDRLRLIALDADDLTVISAHVQDAVLKVADLSWFPRERRFVAMMNRFVWERAVPGSRAARTYQRRRASLHFARVESVGSAGIDRDAKETVLELLAIRFAPGDAPSGRILLDFAGGGSLCLTVECVEAQLADLGPAWSTPHAPRHMLA